MRSSMFFPHSKPWWLRLDGLAVFIFVVGGSFLTGLNQQRFLGLFMITALFLSNGLPGPSFFRQLSPFPPELWCYAAWVAWAGGTGFFVAENIPFFIAGMGKILQMLVMIWTAYAILRFSGGTRIVFFAIIVGGMLQAYAVFSANSSLLQILDPATRQTGMTQNANSLGSSMVWMLVSLAALWPIAQKRQWIWRAAIMALVPVTGFVVLASGSRKAFTAWSFVFAAWSLFGLTNNRGVTLSQIVSRGFIIFILVSIGSFGFPLVMEYTPVGSRFGTLVDRGGGSAVAGIEEDIRHEMYQEGWKMFWSSPVAGVGWSQFRVKFWAGLYSHSDYMEPLATTGLVGFILYQAFYFILLRRIWHLLSRVQNEVDVYRLKVMLIGLAAILLLGVGAPHFQSLNVYMLLATFSCFTWRLANPDVPQWFRAGPLPYPPGNNWMRRPFDTGGSAFCSNFPVRRDNGPVQNPIAERNHNPW